MQPCAGGRGRLVPGWAWPPCAGDLVPICRMAIHRLPSVHDMILFIFNRMQRNMERARNMNNEVGGRNQGLALVQSQVILEADTQHTDRSMASASRVIITRDYAIHNTSPYPTTSPQCAQKALQEACGVCRATTGGAQVR